MLTEQQHTPSPYVIRDYVQEDHNFILATFLRGVYHGNDWFMLIPKKIFMDNYKKVGQAIVSNPNIHIKVACLPDDPNVIIGYSILSSDYQALVWVFVKKRWRNLGIAKSLVPKYAIAYTHITQLGKILKDKIPTAVFNPFYPL